MAIEERRGCGYRKVGGYYLVGNYISISCDRLPFPLVSCPVCGGGIKAGRGYTKINPYRLFGPHDFSSRDERSGIFIQKCNDRIRPCFMCDPKDELALLMNVGEGHYKTPEDFMEEGRRLGISKRIPHIPPELVVGQTVVYLSHPCACEVREPVALQQAMAIVEEAQTMKPRLLETENVTKTLGIFTAFIPQRLEKLICVSNASPDELEKLKTRGVTPVIIPDGDKDHAIG